MNVLRAIEAVLPGSWSRSARDVLAVARLRPVLRRFAELPAGAAPPTDLVRALKEAWGNPGWSAEVPYLEAVAARAARVDGPVVECGSGVSTLLLGLVAGRRGVPVVALEHEPSWHDRVSRRLRACGVQGVSLVLAPLRPFGDYSWYDVPPAAIPPAVRLVVCDGPPQDTPGGRYGAVPALRTRLAPDVEILLDDASRPGELAALARWEQEDGLVARVPAGARGFAVVGHRPHP